MKSPVGMYQVLQNDCGVVYDGRVRGLLVLLLSTFIFTFLFLLPSKILAQSCPSAEAKPDSNNNVIVKIGTLNPDTEYTITIASKGISKAGKTDSNGEVTFDLASTNVLKPDPDQTYTFDLDSKKSICSGNFLVQQPGQKAPTNPTPTPTPTPPLPPCAQWEGLNEDGEYVPISPERIDEYKDKEGEVEASRNNLKCVAINTAIGEISTEPQGFVKRIFSLVLGIAGGIALILIIISGYKFMASQGNPEALTGARDQLTSAVVGLLFIIFAFVILQVIGVDILKIPGFG